MINISTEHEILTEIFDFKHIKELNGCERIYFETLHELKNEEAIYYANCVFVVKNIEKTLVGERVIYSVEALEKFYCDMIDLFEYSETTATLNLSKACDIIFSGTGWTYTLESNLTSVAFENFGNDSKSALFQTVLKRYKREFEVDYRNKNIYIAREIGKDESVVFRYKKNIVAISETVDTKELTTYIEAEGKDGLYVKYTSVNAEKFGVRHAKKIKDERYVNIEELTEYARQSIQDVPLVAFEVDALVIDEDLSLGDKVFVIHEKLGIDIHARVLAIEEMPLDRQKRKTIKLGNFVEVGFSDRVISKVEDYFDATSQADKDLQAKIDAANAAIDKEYNDRVQAVGDAIAKAEADVEKSKEELKQELGQAMTDWDIAFEENKAQVDASIGNVSGILGDYIASNDEIIAEHSGLITDANTAINSMNTDINTAKADISDLFTNTNANAGSIVTVSNDLGALSTTVSEVKTTADSASATATEVKQTAESLSSSVSSLQGTVDAATGDITSMKQDISNVTQTADSISSKVTSLESDNATNKQNISDVTQTAAGLTTKVNSVETTANSALSKATTVEQTASGISQKVTSLETSDGVQNSNISALQQTASGLTSTVSSHTTSISGLETITETHTSQISQTSEKIALVVSDGSTASAVQLTPNAMKFISEEINLFGNVIFNSLVDESTTEILGDKIKTGTIKTSTLLVDKEILVDGTVKAQHFIGVTAELAEITTILFKSEVLQAAWASIGQAVVGQLTADDALLNSLTAKQAFITSVQAIDFQADRIVGGRLRSKNGLLEWNLNDSYLKFTGPSNAMEYTNSGSSAGISFGEVYSSVAGRNVPTVSLYGNQSTNVASNIGLDIMSGEQQINIRADRISFYDHENSTTHGFHIKTTAGDAWNTSIEPWSAGYGELGKSTKGFYSVNCLTIRRQNEATYSNYDMKENIREVPDIVVREVFNTLKVKEYYYKDETFAYSRDKIKVGLIIEDIAPEGNSEYLLSDGGNFLKSDNVAFMNVRMTQLLNAELNEALEMIVDLQQQINELKGA